MSMGWYRLLVGEPPRQCSVSDRSVVFQAEPTHRSIEWPTHDEVARGLRRYLDEGASYEELAGEPGARPWPLPDRASGT